jgi:tetratricopeptide (TPR) repeat protein
MASKIALYREVLEIEPNSKAFFPLARQLAEEGQVDEAIQILARGIGFHPDHLEAKFLLIDILTRHGREGEAETVFTDVGTLLARYPTVWLLWSRAAAARSRDPSLAMLFLGHYFQDDSLTWAEVMERGLRSLSQAAQDSGPAETPQPGEAARPVFEPIPAPVAPAPPSRPEPETDGPPLRGAEEVLALAGLLPEPETVARGAARSGKPREMPVRTRTMASVLASQGDTAGALAIYDELIEAAAPGPERDELVALAAVLAPEAGVAPSGTVADEVPQCDTAPPKGAAKLISLLEVLAGRLEARSGA